VRVLILTSAFYPTIGGAETYAYNLVTGLISKGMTAKVFTDTPSAPYGLPSSAVYQAKKYNIALNESHLIRWEQMYFSLLEDLMECIKSFKPHILHANSFETSILATIANLQYGIPVISTFHEQKPETSPLGIGKARFIFKNPSMDVIAGSKFYLEKGLSHGCEPSKIHLIYHGIDTNLFSPKKLSHFKYRQRWGVPKHETVFLCPARISPRKGQLDLVKAFKNSSAKKSHLILAGTCSSGSIEYFNAIKEEIDGNTNIIFDHQITLEEMPEVYQNVDIVVQPSHEEGLGLAVIEGLSSGLLVVASSVTGITEILNDDIGIMLPAGDIDSWSKSILEISKNKEKYSSMREAGRKMVLETFSIDTMISETIKLYSEIIQ